MTVETQVKLFKLNSQLKSDFHKRHRGSLTYGQVICDVLKQWLQRIDRAKSRSERLLLIYECQKVVDFYLNTRDLSARYYR